MTFDKPFDPRRIIPGREMKVPAALQEAAQPSSPWLHADSS